MSQSSWRTWEPGQRVRINRSGWAGSVVKVNVPREGTSLGTAYVDVRLDQWCKRANQFAPDVARIHCPPNNLEAI